MDIKMSESEYEAKTEHECSLQTELKEDFIKTLQEHHGYMYTDALSKWHEVKEVYLNKIFEAITLEITEHTQSKGEKMKFKKGDKVKIVSTKESGVEYNFNIGDICEIREQGQFHVDGKKSYTVFTKDKSDWWYMYEDGLEGVDDNESRN